MDRLKLKFVWIFLFFIQLSAVSLAKNLDAERADYKKASQALKKNDIKTYLHYRKSLDDYPLTAYLDYQYLLKNVYSTPTSAFKQFHERYADFPFRSELYRRWLLKFTVNDDWESYRKEYEAVPMEIDDPELQCHYLYALYRTGNNQEALNYVPALWEVGGSQPSACDTIFSIWLEKNQLSKELAWKRVSLVIQSGNFGLANYLIKKFLPTTYVSDAKLFIELQKNPSTLSNISKFSHNTPRIREMVQYGIKKSIRKDPEATLSLWESYKKRLSFSKDEITDIESTIALILAKKYHPLAIDWLKKANHHYSNHELNEWHLRVLLRNLRWEDYIDTLAKMPTETTTKESWQYWLARAIEVAPRNNNERHQAKLIYAKLAKERSFYGFLSANHLQLDYALNNHDPKISPAEIQAFEKRGSVQRVKEFLALNDKASARTEWRSLTKNYLTPRELLVAAKYTEKLRWPDQGIWTLITANAWDVLDQRFPLAYKNLIENYARINGLDPHWLFAIARQESAFRADARSHSNAMGLLQLLPSTAKDTARKIKTSYTGSQMLLSPEKNVPLGSAYLSQMANKFDGNRIFATAAYNAGPNRVARWVNENSHLPYDVWIETIPIDETRNYVQNVLSFAVIYGKKLKVGNLQFIKAHEMQANEYYAKQDSSK